MSRDDFKEGSSKAPDEYCQEVDSTLGTEARKLSMAQAGSEIDERRLIRKIDIFVIPWLALLYLLNFLDRSNIGNARVSCSFYPYLCIAFDKTC